MRSDRVNWQSIRLLRYAPFPAFIGGKIEPAGLTFPFVWLCNPHVSVDTGSASDSVRRLGGGHLTRDETSRSMNRCMKRGNNTKSVMSSKLLRMYLAAAIFAGVFGYYIFSALQRSNFFSGIRKGGMYSLFRHDFGIPSQRFSGAEMLRKIKTPELIAEVEKVIEQEGLPADVFYGLSSKVPDERLLTQQEYDREKQEQQQYNIAAVLNDEFQEYDTHQQNDMHKLWDASPIGEWDADEQKFESVRQILSSMEPKRQTIRRKLEDVGNTHFYYIFVRPESLKSSKSLKSVKTSSPSELSSHAGTLVNTWASKYLADYALLEEYAIARALLDGDIDTAIDALAYIFRITQLASTLGNVGVRGDAAMVRLRAFDVMQRVILDAKFEKKHMNRLREMLMEQRDHWTTEYFTWFGDRASGLMLYQRIFVDGPINALTPAELAVWEKREIYSSEDAGRLQNVFVRAFRKYHEADAAFYLQSMQKILNISDKPLVGRLDVLNKINRDILAAQDKRDKDEISMEFFVANLLLQDVDRMMRIFVQDQSALDRAYVAMLLSLGQNNTNGFSDPATDKPYEVHKENGWLSISTANLPRPFRVPVFTQAEPVSSDARPVNMAPAP